MGKEVNLLKNYPRSNRRDQLDQRMIGKTSYDKEVARKFGMEFFDGDRRFGYGGYRYDKKYWGSVVPDICKHYSLGPDSKVLDVGCAKGFMLWDFLRLDPTLSVKGIDISEYAVSNGHPSVKEHLLVGDAREIPFPDNEFDLVISINTVHNLSYEDCGTALQEIERVSSKYAFIVVDAYSTDEERSRIEAWNLTAQTIMKTSEWVNYFRMVGYFGDYYWFIP
jgi:ubiquinone/menaquinone biosynthesis C-methylase UbiE